MKSDKRGATKKHRLLTISYWGTCEVHRYTDGSIAAFLTEAGERITAESQKGKSPISKQKEYEQTDLFAKYNTSDFQIDVNDKLFNTSS